MAQPPPSSSTARAQSPLADTTDLGKRIQNAVVKIMYEKSVWTGFVFGCKGNRCAILTVAHDFHRSGKWLPATHIESRLFVRFYEDGVAYPCRIAQYKPKSDILVLVVTRNKTLPENKLTLAPSSEVLFESQSVGSRGHPFHGNAWSFSEGSILSPKLFNSGPEDKRTMNIYDEKLIYFEHDVNLEVGCSGAPIMKMDGTVVGMHTGGRNFNYEVIGAAPLIEAIAVKEKALERDYMIAQLSRKKTGSGNFEKDHSMIGVNLNFIEYRRDHVVNFKVGLIMQLFLVHRHSHVCNKRSN